MLLRCLRICSIPRPLMVSLIMPPMPEHTTIHCMSLMNRFTSLSSALKEQSIHGVGRQLAIDYFHSFVSSLPPIISSERGTFVVDLLTNFLHRIHSLSRANAYPGMRLVCLLRRDFDLPGICLHPTVPSTLGTTGVYGGNSQCLRCDMMLELLSNERD